MPFTDLQGDGGQRARVARGGVRAEHAPRAGGRVHGRDLAADVERGGGAGESCSGHSERREYFGETDRALALKVPAALEAGLTPILCIGETEGERDNDDTDRKLRQQVKDDLAGVASERLSEVVIAYEPIWAIGTGRVATLEQVQEAIVFIRALVGDRDGAGGGGRADPLRRVGQPGERGRAARA